MQGRRAIVVPRVDVRLARQQRGRQVLGSIGGGPVQRCFPVDVSGVDFGLMRQEQLRHIAMAGHRRGVQGRLSVKVFGQQQFRHFPVALGRRKVQGCSAVVVPGIDVRFVGQQQFSHILVPLRRCRVQRRIAD